MTPPKAPAAAKAQATDPLAALLRLRELPTRLIIGLMSGTSADGTDAALCEVSGAGEDTQVKLLAFVGTQFSRDLRERIFALGEADTRELSELDVLIGQVFAEAAFAVCAKAGRSMKEVHLIGSHGQTAAHLPRVAGQIGATMQIAEPAVIAEQTGCPVISDFRVRDMAAGGEGAPLVPLVDYILCRAPGRTRAIQNIGGIANVTLVGDRLDEVVAFDTGPGNMPLDAVARAASRGTESYDLHGARAARGTIDAALLAELNAHPYLALSPPKSTGRELFGRRFVNPLLDRWKARAGGQVVSSQLDDLLATLTRYTAETIVRSYREHLPRFPDEVFVCGGGARNPTLMRHLAELCAPVPVLDSSAIGIDPDAKEAMAFGVLANETLHGHPGNLPQVTGAAGPRVLGKITLQ
ncbi:MAG TPA: anhydro-N-acetylmuramic acid kinase [Polyangia bacterium]